MEVIINYTRLTTSDRLADRFLTCQVYSPQDEKTREKGTVFSQVEILNPWFSTSQVGQSIINTLIRDYYKTDDSSDLNNFETAIKGVNESLAQVAQAGETDWIGKLSSVLALVNNGEAHFAQTGQSQAYLYRGDNINHITEGLENEASPHPLKTFTNLTSGTLQEGDRIIVANPSFFEVINPGELKVIMIQNHPAQAALEVAKIFKGRGIKHANAIFMEITTKNALANIAPDQKIDTVYVNEQLSSLSVNLKNIYRNIFLPISVSFKSFLVKSYSTSKNKLRSKTKAKPELTQAVQTAKTTSAPHKTPIQNIPKTRSSGMIGKTLDPLRFYIIKLKNKLNRFLIKIGFGKPHRWRIYLIALAGVIIILAIVIALSLISKNNRTRNKELQDKLNQITSLEGEVSAQAVTRSSAEILPFYKQIVALSSELRGTKYSEQANQSYERAYAKILEITGAVEIELTDVKTLPFEIMQLAYSENGVYLISRDKILYNLESDKAIDLKDKIEGEISQINAVENNIALSTNDNTLYIYYPETDEVKKQQVKLNYSGKLGSYFDNLYVLDPLSNQIWKIINDGGYGQNTAYIVDDSISLADTVGLAIDGSVYVVSKSCNISRISRGEVVSDFLVTSTADENLESCQNIFTSEAANSMFVIGKSQDGTRIVELRKNGTFVGQFIPKNTTCDNMCFIDPTKRILYHIEDKDLRSSAL